MQVEAGESNLSLFKTFSLFFFLFYFYFFSHERVLEELALLKRVYDRIFVKISAFPINKTVPHVLTVFKGTIQLNV